MHFEVDGGKHTGKGNQFGNFLLSDHEHKVPPLIHGVPLYIHGQDRVIPTTYNGAVCTVLFAEPARSIAAGLCIHRKQHAPSDSKTQSRRQHDNCCGSKTVVFDRCADASVMSCRLLSRTSLLLGKPSRKRAHRKFVCCKQPTNDR